VAYLTGAQAATRLATYAITATPSDGDLKAASLRLDQSGATWEGNDDDPPAPPPDDLLDAVALLAYEISYGEKPAIVQHKVIDESVTYAEPAKSRHLKLVETLLWPYGGRLEAHLA
jgi:hypothetical protein